ncbi:hypothetical protein ABW19_dt0200892 [Dactylella cylindrospora]|nr:hypothetical protein ABW19_dt0200892 [Dactylella cylindrospora]
MQLAQAYPQIKLNPGSMSVRNPVPVDQLEVFPLPPIVKGQVNTRLLLRCNNIFSSRKTSQDPWNQIPGTARGSCFVELFILLVYEAPKFFFFFFFFFFSYSLIHIHSLLVCPLP